MTSYVTAMDFIKKSGSTCRFPEAYQSLHKTDKQSRKRSVYVIVRINKTGDLSKYAMPEKQPGTM